MQYFKPGTMQPVKKILGAIIGILGLGLLFMADKVLPMITNYKIVFGLIFAFSGYLFFIAGRQRR